MVTFYKTPGHNSSELFKVTRNKEKNIGNSQARGPIARYCDVASSGGLLRQKRLILEGKEPPVIRVC